MPFLVVYGGWIAKLLVVGAAALGIAAVRWRWRRRERSETAGIVAARAAVADAPAPGPATLRGTLRGRAATLVPGAGVPGLPLTDRDGELAVEVAGERVELRGPVWVVRGSEAAAAWRGLPRGTPEAIAKDAAGARGARRLFAVRDGDEVIAQGTLARRARDEPGDYRAPAGVWVLEPTAGTSAIELTATRPAIRPPASGPVRLAGYAALFGVVAYGVLAGIGSSLVDSAKHDHRHGRTELASFGALAIASALPRSRHAALVELDSELEYDFVRSEPTLQMRFEVAELRAGCGARAHLEIEEERYDAALATAAACGNTGERVDALAHLGRYGEAATLLQGTDPYHWPARAAVVAIGAGRWRDAAAAADAVARRTHDDHALDETAVTSIVARQTCLAAFFRAKAGDAAAAAQLAAPASASDPGCRIAHALLLPPAERGAALAAASQEARDHEILVAVLADELAWADGEVAPGDDLPDLFRAVSLLGGRPDPDERAWFAPLALATRAPTAADLPVVLAERAVREVVAGDLQAARADLAKARTLASPDAVGLREDVPALDQALALHTPGPIPSEPDVRRPHPAIAAQLALRGGKVPANLGVLTAECSGRLRPALEAAVAGDGGPLAEALTRCHLLFDAGAGLVLAVAPRVTRHRADLAAAARLYHEEYGVSIGFLPFRLLAEGVTRRDIARLLGDEPEAKRWQDILDRQLKVLEDPDKLVGFLLWQRL